MSSVGTSGACANATGSLIYDADTDSTDHDTRYNAILSFLNAHGISSSKRKIRDLLALSREGLASYKINVIIASCCKVSGESERSTGPCYAILGCKYMI